MKHMKTLSILIISLLFAFISSSNIYGQEKSSKNTKSDPNTPIFEIKNDLNQTVFAVYPGGVRVFVNDQLKAAGGGFTVGRLSTGKAVAGDIFSVVPNNVNVYIDDSTGVKAAGGGFTVGRLSTGKAAGDENFLTVTPDSTRVYINETSKSGFAVGKLGAVSGLQNFMFLRKGNYFIGHNSGERTTGLYNLFLGYESGFSNTTGTSNTFVGHLTGYSNTSGYNNIFMGNQAGYNNELGYMNVFIGYQAAFNNIGDGGGFNGTYNVMVGYRAGYSNTSGGGHVIMGYNAATQVSTSNYMTAIGYNAGAGSTGSYNVFLGGETGKQYGVGDYNTCVGMSAGVAAAGTGNSYYGAQSGWHNDGSNNTAIGRAAGYGANTYAYNNATYIGAYSGLKQTSGSNNTFIGYSAGRSSTTGAGNIFLGYQAGYYETTVSNRLFIANSSTSTPLIYGEFDNQLVRINGDLQYTGTLSQSSDIRLKTNLTPITGALNKIQSLNGYYFNWNKNAISELKYNNKRLQIGLIAQDIEKVLPELVIDNANGYKSVDYTKISAVLIEAIKEQQKQIEELKEKNNNLSKQVSEIDLLKAEMNELKAMVKEISDTKKESTRFSSK